MAAKYFFKKALRSFHVSKPRVITVGQSPIFPIAIVELQKRKKDTRRQLNQTSQISK